MEVFLRTIFVFISMLNFSFGQITNGLNSTDVKGVTANINCLQQDTNITNIEHLILNCLTPTKPFSEYLSGLNITTLRKLTLKIESNSTILNSTHFSNLNVEELVVDFKFDNKSGQEYFLKISNDVLYVLDKVKVLEFKGIAFYEETTIGDEKAPTCSNLESLKITVSDIRKVKNGWLKPCSNLKNLHIAKLRQRNGTKEVRRNLLAGAESLLKLDIHECYIEELNDELADLKHLMTLDVSHNQIHYALTSTVLPSLRELDLSYNHIFSSALFASGAEKQPNLRVISLDYNTVLDICDSLDYRTTVNDEPTWHEPLQGRYVRLSSVQKLSLRGTITQEMCFGNMYLDALEYFDLSESKITAFHFKALPKTQLKRLEVNVSGCPIRSMPGESFTEDHYKELQFQELRITGLNLTLDCDCEEYLWLARAARERRVILDGAWCSSGVDLSRLPEDQLQCTKYHCGVCTCRRYWQDNATDVECDGELRAIPHEPGLRKLFAAGNLIENVTEADIPDTLIYLDLSKNHIARMSEAASKALFTNPQRKVRFLGNPIICDCENEPMILELMDHWVEVEDYSLLTCIDDGRFIKDVIPADLCLTTSRMFTTAMLAVLGAGIGIAALLAGLYYRYGQTLKVFLYSRGLCLFCIREDELDADRPYDAFLSFSHKDEDFVTENILPELERDNIYKICVHYRNWIPGELIPTQINRSVEQSKKTIIVLSKNFLESVWGLLEFRTAHLSALRDGRARVVIVIIDNILEDEKLDGELRSYLRTNTYVKWGDPWFWDKLKYALPHSRNTAEMHSFGMSPQNSSQLASRCPNSGSTDSAIEMEIMRF